MALSFFKMNQCQFEKSYRRQYWMMDFVASSSQSGSASDVINSMELKNFTALGFGLPSGCSPPNQSAGAALPANWH